MNASAYSSLDYIYQLHALFISVYLIPEDVLSGNSKAIGIIALFKTVETNGSGNENMKANIQGVSQSRKIV